MQAKREVAAGCPLRSLVGLVLLGIAVVSTCESRAFAAGSPSLEFNRDIRPILAENCFYCHGQDANKRQAELRLDVRDAAIEAGAIVPSDPAGSEILFRINSSDPQEQMPPPKSRRLSAAQKQRLERWIAEGAHYAPHWSFVAANRPAEPAVREVQWVRNPIDRFVLAKLEAEGMQHALEADRPTLIKRLSIDLLGLPPSPEDVDAFVADNNPKAYANLVDRLLASPHYGERMALLWLDAARYADSNGFQQDGDTWQWVWRDWLVKALNDDMPFDQLTIRLLAGDLLPNATTGDKIASGFNRNHLLNGEGGAIPEEQRFVNLFDRIDTTATTWLGLTMACAQCHDHKYDPITQRDYYSLLDAFNRVPESGVPQFFSPRIRVAAPFVELPTEENKVRIAELEAKLKSADAERNRAYDAIKRQLGEYRGDQLPRVMIMSDAQPRQTAILSRGQYLTPTTRVNFATPAFLPPMPAGAPANRLGLARWLVMPEHPLTARVQVNRMWQNAFGAGIVKTSEDFGVQSEFPVHGELLDWLAVEFRTRGWSIKAMQRLIVTSATYRQSSRSTSKERARDSENRLYARASRFRMPSLILRDWALASSGLLELRIGGRPVYPYQPGAIWEALAITKERDFTYPASSGKDLYRRSIYTFWRRTVGPANMFDASNRQTCRVRSATTSTPLHALTTLNDPTWVEAARALAQQAMTTSNIVDACLSDAFRRVTCRKPSDFDLKVLHRAYERQAAIYAKDTPAARALLAVGESKRDETLDVAQHAALSAVCLAIFNFDEALTRE
ncbi:MAG: PSD1 and planctomycete cytochrome C domain-containing protein [Isosphaeraceae bacterium]